MLSLLDLKGKFTRHRDKTFYTGITIEVYPCPCKNGNVVFRMDDKSDEYWIVTCSYCSAYIRELGQERAVLIWNRMVERWKTLTRCCLNKSNLVMRPTKELILAICQVCQRRHLRFGKG